MPLTEKGEHILSKMLETYGSDKKAKEVFYASRNKGTITGVDSTKLDALMAKCDAFDHRGHDEISVRSHEANKAHLARHSRMLGGK